jgi:hypothetical protein
MSRRDPFVDPAQGSLFDGADVGEVHPVAAPTPPQPQPQPQPQRPPPEDRDQVDTTPAATLQSLLAPAVFRHPQADREIRLGAHVVGYALKRVRRRSIGFIVGVEGLSVNAPRWVGLRDIESALVEKGEWILAKLREQRERGRRLLEAKVDWRDGTAIPFLGETVIVVLDPRAGTAPGGALLNTDATALPGVPRLTLHVGLGHAATPAQIRDAVQSWLQRQARRLFEERCRLYAARLGVRYTRLGLSSAQTRWGSANASGAIRLNWRLIHFALSTIDYVVAHELAHLREMNHSPRFWDVVRSVLPEYERARGELRADVLPQFD